MPASTLTFGVQIGSDGFAVAQEVARRLGYGYHDWEITGRASNTFEDTDLLSVGFAERIMSRLMAAAVFESEIPSTMLGASSALVQQTLRIVTLDKHRPRVEAIVRDIATAGQAVIIGHGSQAILTDEPGVLKVLVVRPFMKRAEELMRLEPDLTLQGAMKVASNLDELKHEYLQRAYGIDWLEASNYDLVLNMGQMSVEMAVETVLACANGAGWEAEQPRKGLRLLKILPHGHEDDGRSADALLDNVA